MIHLFLLLIVTTVKSFSYNEEIVIEESGQTNNVQHVNTSFDPATTPQGKDLASLAEESQLSDLGDPHHYGHLGKGNLDIQPRTYSETLPKKTLTIKNNETWVLEGYRLYDLYENKSLQLFGTNTCEVVSYDLDTSFHINHEKSYSFLPKNYILNFEINDNYPSIIFQNLDLKTLFIMNNLSNFVSRSGELKERKFVRYLEKKLSKVFVYNKIGPKIFSMKLPKSELLLYGLYEHLDDNSTIETVTGTFEKVTLLTNNIPLSDSLKKAFKKVKINNVMPFENSITIVDTQNNAYNTFTQEFLPNWSNLPPSKKNPSAFKRLFKKDNVIENSYCVDDVLVLKGEKELPGQSNDAVMDGSLP